MGRAGQGTSSWLQDKEDDGSEGDISEGSEPQWRVHQIPNHFHILFLLDVWRVGDGAYLRLSSASLRLILNFEAHFPFVCHFNKTANRSEIGPSRHVKGSANTKAIK